MKAARSSGADSSYPWPVNSRQSATASSIVGADRSSGAVQRRGLVGVGRCRITDQKKPASRRSRASAKARSRSSSVDSASSSAKDGWPTRKTVIRS